MKEMHYRAVKKMPNFNQNWAAVYPRIGWELAENLAKEYLSSDNNMVIGEIDDRIIPVALICALSGINLSGKTILDLGCGSTGGTIDREKERAGFRFEPWLLRALYKISQESPEEFYKRRRYDARKILMDARGVKLIGIDIGNLSKEKFEKYQIDFAQPKALDFLASQSVDLVNLHWVFTSPEMAIRLKMERGDHSEAERRLRAILIPQLERIVKPEGYLIHCDG